MDEQHIPVLAYTIEEGFKSHLNSEKSVFRSRPGLIVDCTFGRGGHTIRLMNEFPEDYFLAIDQDPAAQAAFEALRLNPEKIQFAQKNFKYFKEVIKLAPQIPIKAVLMDLGVSSPQLDQSIRGFSFKQDGPLDMRMDLQQELTAELIVNTFSESELCRIFEEYGEERYARKIARELVKKRSEVPFTTTAQLENLLFYSYPPQLRHQKTHPATRVFQALRIYVNSELAALETALEDIAELLAPGGILAIISFHSLEDRIVKHKFKVLAKDKKVEILTKKPITPTAFEILHNKRARSAKLRMMTKNL